jgi:hypothetical protein
MTPLREERAIQPRPHADFVGPLPEYCEHCYRYRRVDARWFEIQYSSIGKAWLCLACHLRALRAA